MKKKSNLLMTSPFYLEFIPELEKHFNLNKFWETNEASPATEAIVTSSKYPFPDHLYELPQLKVISCYGVGFDAINLEKTKSKNIIVTNTPDVLSEAVADHALGLLLGLTKQICEGDRFVRKGLWPKQELPLGMDLKGKICGIAGMGRIGSEIAKRAEVFGMKVSYYGRSPKKHLSHDFYNDLNELASKADVLIIAMPGNKDTKHIVDERILNSLGKKGILINISRGTLIDELALLKALQEGRILSAGLDVFENDPHIPEEFFTLENVVLTPHIGSATEETRSAMGELVIENLKSYFETGKVITPVKS
jgi:hydroxypyruvate reductase 2